MSDCLFCKIADHKIPATIVYEDDHTVIFKDIAPQAPVHLIVIPRSHLAAIHDMTADHTMLGTSIFAAIKIIVNRENLEANGYRLVINAGKDAQQSVPHLHVHILAGRPMDWPPG